MSQQNVELVRRALAAVNERDFETMDALSHPDFEMHLVGVAGEPVLYRGAEGIREFISDMAESWDFFEFEADELRDAGDRVVALGRVRARGRASGIDVEDERGWIVEVRDGKVSLLRAFHHQREALEEAGIA